MAKICMLAYTYYASDPRVRREAEALAARGDEVDFICLRECGGAMRCDYGGVRLHPIGSGKYQGNSRLAYMIQYAGFLIRSFWTLSVLYLKNGYDIIQVHTMPDFLVFAALLPKLAGAKVILDVHDLMPELHVCKFNSNPRRFSVRLIGWLERRSIAFADRALAVHVPQLNTLVGHGNPAGKFTVIMNVPDNRIFYKNGGRKPDSKFRLIYHGTLARRHGLEVALHALRLARAKIPDIELVVIGTGDNLPRIKALADELDLRECVRFLGKMPVEELPAHLRQADAGIVPLLYDSFTRHMLPLKLMEYVGMGIPVIASRTETIQTYFNDKMVRYCKPGDAQELAAAILEFYQDPEKRRQFAHNASGFNDSFNWGREKFRYYAVVDSLLGKELGSPKTEPQLARR